MEWTKETLASKSRHERETIYKNARKKNSPEAVTLVKMIEEAGLPYSDAACPTSDDPLTIAIYDLIHSAMGRQAAIDAIEKGLPPLAGIDPLLLDKLGTDYGAHNMTTAVAGRLIAELMRSLGYKEAGTSRPLLPGSVAKTGQMWTNVPMSKTPKITKQSETATGIAGGIGLDNDGNLFEWPLGKPIIYKVIMKNGDTTYRDMNGGSYDADGNPIENTSE